LRKSVQTQAWARSESVGSEVYWNTHVCALASSFLWIFEKNK
jgi:hypothetical protein